MTFVTSGPHPAGRRRSHQARSPVVPDLAGELAQMHPDAQVGTSTENTSAVRRSAELPGTSQNVCSGPGNVPSLTSSSYAGPRGAARRAGRRTA